MALEKKRRPRRGGTARVPTMLIEMTAASVETLARRTRMMVTGTCTPAEYQRMVAEKVEAAYKSGVALASPRTRGKAKAVLDPWHRGVTANAKRLRKRTH